MEEEKCAYDEYDFLQKYHGWPEILLKALIDDFEYSMILKNGLELHFNTAVCKNPEWVWVKNFEDERSLEVRVSEIAFIADDGNKYQSVWGFNKN